MYEITISNAYFWTIRACPALYVHITACFLSFLHVNIKAESCSLVSWRSGLKVHIKTLRFMLNSTELIIRTLNSDLCSSRPEIYLGERISHASVLQEHQKLVKFSQKPLGYADSERRDTHNSSFYVPLTQRRSVRRCQRAQ